MKIPVKLKRMVARRMTMARLRELARSGEEGQSMVEFGIVAPVLLIVLTGIFSFGIALNQYEVLTNAVSDGARAFALSRGNTAVTDPCAYAATTVANSAATLNSSNLNFTITYTPASGTGTPYTGTGSTGSASPTCSSQALATGDSVTVQASYSVTAFVFKLGNKSMSLSATTTELVQ
jgi:Flp pilus assembly protein TadG